MKIYCVRHQCAGIVYDSPFASPPTPEQCAEVLARVAEQHGTHHKKTRKPYWAKVVALENGTMTTIGGCNGESVEEVDVKAAGHCPLRAAGHKRDPEAVEEDRRIEREIKATAREAAYRAAVTKGFEGAPEDFTPDPEVLKALEDSLRHMRRRGTLEVIGAGIANVSGPR